MKGNWLKYTNLDFGNGATSFESRAASSTEGGIIELHLGSTSGELIGTCNGTRTAGWQSWTTISCDVTPVSWFNNLYLVFTNGTSFLMNLNWWQFGQFTSIKNTSDNQELFKVLSTGYSKILTDTQLGDMVTLYNPLGQKLDHFHSNSNQELLKNFKGLVLIQVKRGN